VEEMEKEGEEEEELWHWEGLAMEVLVWAGSIGDA
jgi:hypothetical protein